MAYFYIFSVTANKRMLHYFFLSTHENQADR